MYGCRCNLLHELFVCRCRENPRPVERRFTAQRDIEQGEHLVGTRAKENQTVHYLNAFIPMKHFLCVVHFIDCLDPVKVHLCVFKKAFSAIQMGFKVAPHAEH